MYDKIRQQYKPDSIKVLLIAESPPPSGAIESSRHFYRTDRIRTGDRLFINTIKAIYPEAMLQSEPILEQTKEQWLRKFQSAGWYMIEALEESLEHDVSKTERQALIQKSLPRLIARVRKLINANTTIILVKSNVFEVAVKPLRKAGFTVLNSELVDYPGQFNQRAYREKLSSLITQME